MDNTLLNKLKNLPKSTGIYQYFDKNNKLLYIGKAKNLQNRVKSYFRFTPSLAPSHNLSVRIDKMVNEISDIDYLLVSNEHEALILENTLIKQLKPKYNILLRDDKTYPYIYIDMSQDFPRFEVTRSIINKPKIKYFGPFSGSVKYILQAIYDSFDLVQRKNCLREKKVCLFYQIKKCLAPCESKITPLAYKKIVSQAIIFLNDRKLMDKIITSKMNDFASKLQFEEALSMKKTLLAIKKSVARTPVDFANCENMDVFTIFALANKACILKTFIRDGKLTSTASHIIRDQMDIDIFDIYQRVVVDFYSSNNMLKPDEVLIAHTQDSDVVLLLEIFLHTKFGKKIAVNTPKIGLKKQLTNTTLVNAEALLKKNISENSDDFLLLSLKDIFSLSNIPFEIEVFDNSHMFNQAKVGAKVAYSDKSFLKSSYRVYHLSGNDEYSHMKEMLIRRIDAREKDPLPNLWILDGGRALLNLALFLLQSLNISLDVIAIAKEKVNAKAYRSKGKASDIIYTKDDIFKLKTDSKELLFVQKLRDESHRFAIKNHRILKAKEDKQVSLLKVDGIGEAKVKKLLNYFASFENIKKASFEDLKVVLSSNDAKHIYKYFQ